MSETKERLVKRWRVPRGYVYIRQEFCKGCGFCIEFCPKRALAQAAHFNDKGYHPPEVVDPKACVLCGFCERICPDFAIWIEEEKDEAP